MEATGFRAEVLGNVIRLQGELDIATAPELAACFERVSHSTVVVNATGLRFIDCRGLDVIVEAARRFRHEGDDLIVVGARGAVRRVFVLVGEEGLLGD